MTRARRDLIVISVVAVVVAAALIESNGAERIAAWASRHETWQFDEIFATLTVLGVGFAAFAFRRWRELVHAQRTTRILRGVLPICASCQKMRDENGAWRRFEEVIREKSEAQFSHGLCPECLARYEAMIPSSGSST